jgi:hypothetical protein
MPPKPPACIGHASYFTHTNRCNGAPPRRELHNFTPQFAVLLQVQRPRLLEIIALDLFILRSLAKAVRRLRKLNSNLPMLIDDWASSIYREMSYRNEASNAREFKELFAHYTEVRTLQPVPSLCGRARHSTCASGARCTCYHAHVHVRVHHSILQS